MASHNLFNSENFISFLYILVLAASFGLVKEMRRCVRKGSSLMEPFSLDLTPILASYSSSKFIFWFYHHCCLTVRIPFVLAVSCTHAFIKIPFTMHFRILRGTQRYLANVKIKFRRNDEFENIGRNTMLKDNLLSS